MRARFCFLFVNLIASAFLVAACGTGNHSGNAAPANSESSAASRPSVPDSSARTAEFQKVIAEYHDYVLQECDDLVKDTEAFTAAIKSGDTNKAKQLYSSTRSHYERIEPISEAFVNLDLDIDALDGDVAPDKWRGFHKLEKALWVSDSGISKDEEAGYADRLLNDVKLLRDNVKTMEMDVPMLISGAVTLLNEVSSFKVTGEEDRYSHTDLVDFAANVEGAQQIFNGLHDQVEESDAELAKKISDRFDATFKALAPYKDGKGYVLYTTLSRDQTRKLSRTIDALAEPLSMIGSILVVRE